MAPKAARPYQIDCHAAVVRDIQQGYNKVLYVLPTGCGKTFTFVELIKHFVAEGKRVLVLVHRKTLMNQAFKEIIRNTTLEPNKVWCEQGLMRSQPHHQVVVGMVQTCVNTTRLADGHFDVIIADESHRAAAHGWQKVFERFGVPEWCTLIGCTATPQRGDKKSLFAIDDKGVPVLLETKDGAQIVASPENCVFDKLSYNYEMIDAIRDGWLVDFDVRTVKSDTDLSGVKTVAGDFNDKELAKRVNNSKRTLQAIHAWKDAGGDRIKTMAFCVDIQHAHDTADLFKQAGYNAVAIDGTMPDEEQDRLYKQFVKGEIDVLVNCMLYTEGADIPDVGCIIVLRPTKNWTLLRQIVGRGVRTLTGLLDGLDTKEERKAAIRASQKPSCLIIDVHDICRKNNPLSIPSVLGLPFEKFDTEGHGLEDIQNLLDTVEEEVKKEVMKDAPISFTELKVKLKQVSLYKAQDEQLKMIWTPNKEGYSYAQTMPGYSAALKTKEDKYILEVKHAGQTLFEKSSKAEADFSNILKKAKEYADSVMKSHKQSQMKTSEHLTEKQNRCLRIRHTPAEIDKMTVGYAKKLIAQYMNEYHNRVKEYAP